MQRNVFHMIYNDYLFIPNLGKVFSLITNSRNATTQFIPKSYFN